MTQLSFRQLAAKTRGKSREKFLAEHPHPWVVTETMDTGRGQAFQTVAGLKDIRKLMAQGVGTARLVHPVAMSGRHKFGTMITVGRASNNDIIIQEPSVSKFHAYFNEDAEGDGFVLADAGSTYGTKLGLRTLEADRPYPVKSGDRITLADSVVLTFYLPGDFYDQLVKPTR